MVEKKTSYYNILKTIVALVALVAAVGSLYFMFNTGRKQNSVILLGLFTGWVLSPYLGFFLLHKIFNRATIPFHNIIYLFIIFFSIVSFIAYSGTLTMPGTKPAFIFLIVPLIEWFGILTIFFIGKKFLPIT